MEDLISVIVRVYKVEKYLNKCVDSIINQTYKNLEIIFDCYLIFFILMILLLFAQKKLYNHIKSEVK